MDFDTIKITILKDGTIKSVTDPISQDNHDSAESFLKRIARLAGGLTKREARADRKHSHTHTHSDGTTHEHH